jgi:hypothetical protein
MSARIERIDKEGNRWVVSGNNQSDLEQGVSALRATLDRNEEATSPRRIGRPPKDGIAKSEQGKHERLHTAIALLCTIRDAGETGADSSALFSAAGKERAEAKALGPLMGMLGRVLRDYHLAQNKVYVTTGFSPNKRWVLQAEISDAIKKLEDALKTDQH